MKWRLRISLSLKCFDLVSVIGHGLEGKGKVTGLKVAVSSLLLSLYSLLIATICKVKGSERGDRGAQPLLEWIPRKREAEEVMKWVPSPKNNIQTLEAEAKGLSDQVDRLTGEVYNLTVQKFMCWRSSASTNKQRYRVGKRLEVTGGMVL
ncbi:hypothetical protein DY000_02032785 [Brassica cretica]|uniref:Uncharacterized protein n=1 Tax=Brassica cretica TaxID=69181 RepID=A0ABQ7DU86_BRACR|nr:hypothetical protein DY000_02032785 [Brassica cretica]